MSNTKQMQRLQKQVEKIKKQSEEHLNGWKRAQADFENYKKEEIKRIGKFKEYIQRDFILQILPILDNFDLALKHTPKDLAENEWVKGIIQIKNQLGELLKQNGVLQILTKKGDEFNPELHEAVRAVKSKEKDVIVKVLQKGYLFNEKLLRPTKVEVGE